MKNFLLILFLMTLHSHISCDCESFCDKKNQFLMRLLTFKFIDIAVVCWVKERRQLLLLHFSFYVESWEKSWRQLAFDSRHSLVVSQNTSSSLLYDIRDLWHDMWNREDKINCLHFCTIIKKNFSSSLRSCSLSWINFPVHLRLFLSSLAQLDFETKWNITSFFSRRIPISLKMKLSSQFFYLLRPPKNLKSNHRKLNN